MKNKYECVDDWCETVFSTYDREEAIAFAKERGLMVLCGDYPVASFPEKEDESCS